MSAGFPPRNPAVFLSSLRDISFGDKIYKRPTKAHGIVSGQMAPIKPAGPKL